MINSIDTSAFSAAQIELLHYIVSEDKCDNAETLIGLMGYHADCGIFSVTDYKHNMLVVDHYELFRDVYGYRPSNFNYEALSISELEEEIQKVHLDNERFIHEKKLQKEEYSRFIQARKAKNAYKPNLAFGNLK